MYLKPKQTYSQMSLRYNVTQPFPKVSLRHLPEWLGHKKSP